MQKLIINSSDDGNNNEINENNKKNGSNGNNEVNMNNNANNNNNNYNINPQNEVPTLSSQNDYNAEPVCIAGIDQMHVTINAYDSLVQVNGNVTNTINWNNSLNSDDSNNSSNSPWIDWILGWIRFILNKIGLDGWR